jgi:DNA-binding transcriptional ArsR family regulator
MESRVKFRETFGKRIGTHAYKVACIARPTASVHAKVLAEAGFITTERDGRQAGHSFNPDSITRLCDDLIRLLDVPEGGND